VTPEPRSGRSWPGAKETFVVNDNEKTQPISRLMLDREAAEYLLEAIGRLNPRGRRLLNELARELKQLKPGAQIHIQRGEDLPRQIPQSDVAIVR
jgi:hypothetical protein